MIKEKETLNFRYKISGIDLSDMSCVDIWYFSLFRYFSLFNQRLPD